MSVIYELLDQSNYWTKVIVFTIILCQLFTPNSKAHFKLPNRLQIIEYYDDADFHNRKPQPLTLS